MVRGDNIEPECRAVRRLFEHTGDGIVTSALVALDAERFADGILGAEQRRGVLLGEIDRSGALESVEAARQHRVVEDVEERRVDDGDGPVQVLRLRLDADPVMPHPGSPLDLGDLRPHDRRQRPRRAAAEA